MKRENKKALYESIMTSVAREVKKTLNETVVDIEDNETALLEPRTMHDVIIQYRQTYTAPRAQILEKQDKILQYANERNVMMTVVPAEYGHTGEYMQCPDILLIGHYDNVKNVVKKFWTGYYNHVGYDNFDQIIKIIEYEKRPWNG